MITLSDLDPTKVGLGDAAVQNRSHLVRGSHRSFGSNHGTFQISPEPGDNRPVYERNHCLEITLVEWKGCVDGLPKKIVSEANRERWLTVDGQ